MTRPVEIFVTDHAGAPLVGATVTVTVPTGPPLRVTSGPMGAATLQLPDNPAAVVAVHTPAGTVTAPVADIADQLGPTCAISRERARAKLTELASILGGSTVDLSTLRIAVGKLAEIARDVVDAVE